MRTQRYGRLIAAAFSAALLAGPGFAQSTPDPLAPGAAAESGAEPGKSEAAKPDAASSKAEPKAHKAAKPKGRAPASIEVTVHNDRSVGMVELRVGPAGSQDLKKVVGPLAFGRKTVIHLKRTKDCLYDIHAQFADEADSDQTGVDLCTDKAINLTD